VICSSFTAALTLAWWLRRNSVARHFAHLPLVAATRAPAALLTCAAPSSIEIGTDSRRAQLTPEHELHGVDLDLTAEAQWSAAYPQEKLDELVNTYVRTTMDGPLQYARRLEGQMASMQDQMSAMHQDMHQKIDELRNEMRTLLGGTVSVIANHHRS
jgi:hypothetical protein